MLITSYINRTQNCDLLYLVVFEVLIPKVWNVFIELQDIYIYIYIYIYIHSETSLNRTPLGPNKMFGLEGCSVY